MKKLFDSLRTPTHERIELAVKKVAECAADASYHAQLASYYLNQRDKINPSVSAADAYEYARLFGKHEEHTVEHAACMRKERDANAKYTALVKSRA